MRFRALIAPVVVLPLLIAACGSSSSKDTTAAGGKDTVATSAAPAAADTTSAETTSAETTSAETTSADTTSAEVAAADTTAAATDTVAGGTPSPSSLAAALPSADEIMKQLLMTMNGGKEPTSADVACMGKEFPKDKLDAFMKAMSGASTAPGSAALTPLMTAMFKCKPAGLSESLASSLNSDGSLDAVPKAEMTCLAEGMIDLLVKEPRLLDQFVGQGGTANLTPQDKQMLTGKAKPSVVKCVKDPAQQAKILASMAK
jgi:phage-related tail protein